MQYTKERCNGDCDANDKLTFFDSIQSLSKRASAREINDSHLYVGKEPYIYRVAGDRTFCIYGDTLNCIDDDNLRFITDSKNGLIKSATENYTTVYAFLLSLQLLVVKNDIEDEDIEYLINSPSRLSNEDNIREVIAFPMSGEAKDLMCGAPGDVTEKQLREVHIKIRE